MAWTVDESRWPVVVVGVPKQAYADLAGDLARINALHRHGVRFSLVLDVAAASAPDAAERRAIADAIAKGAAHAPLYAMAVVSSSPMARGVFKVLHWLAPAKHPTQIFDDVNAAIDWARARANAGRA